MGLHGLFSSSIASHFLPENGGKRNFRISGQYLATYFEP
jgi:hypothetical protein